MTLDKLFYSYIDLGMHPYDAYIEITKRANHDWELLEKFAKIAARLAEDTVNYPPTNNREVN